MAGSPRPPSTALPVLLVPMMHSPTLSCEADTTGTSGGVSCPDGPANVYYSDARCCNYCLVSQEPHPSRIHGQ